MLSLYKGTLCTEIHLLLQVYEALSCKEIVNLMGHVACNILCQFSVGNKNSDEKFSPINNNTDYLMFSKENVLYLCVKWNIHAFIFQPIYNTVKILNTYHV